MGDGLISAYLFDRRGGGTEIGWDALRQWTPDQGLIWVHLDYSAPSAQRWLAEESGLDEIIAEALCAEETRPRVVATPTGVLVILRGVNTNPGAEPEDMVSLRVWTEPHRVISTRKRRLLSIQDLRDAIAAGEGPKTSGEFLVEIADRLVARMGGVIEKIDDTVYELEDGIMTREGSQIRPVLAEMRREAIMLRRYLAPQREAITRLQTERVPWLDDADRMRLREVADRVMRYVEELDAARERSGVIGEELASRLSEQLNQRMYVLAVVAAFFLPLGFLTGLLGINVGGMPGAESSGAFAAVTALLVGVVIVQLIVFKWRRWL